MVAFMLFLVSDYAKFVVVNYELGKTEKTKVSQTGGYSLLCRALPTASLVQYLAVRRLRKIFP
jgi:hypothetical protein